MIAPTEPAGKPAVLGVSAHLPERPRLAPGLRLAGQMRESAFVEPPWLLEREGAGYIQLTELLYRGVEQCTGQRSVEDIADQVSLATGRRVSADNVRYLLARCLLPRGLVLPANGATVPPGDRGRSGAQHADAPVPASPVATTTPAARPHPATAATVVSSPASVP